jgi:hypothetical protein
MVTQEASVRLVMEKGFAIELRQGIEGENAVLRGAILQSIGEGVWQEVHALESLAIAPMSRNDYKSAAPAAFAVSWDGDLLSVAWGLPAADEHRAEFQRAELIAYGAPVGLEIELEVGAAIFSDFVVEAP